MPTNRYIGPVKFEVSDVSDDDHILVVVSLPEEIAFPHATMWSHIDAVPPYLIQAFNSGKLPYADLADRAAVATFNEIEAAVAGRRLRHARGAGVAHSSGRRHQQIDLAFAAAVVQLTRQARFLPYSGTPVAKSTQHLPPGVQVSRRPGGIPSVFAYGHRSTKWEPNPRGGPHNRVTVEQILRAVANYYRIDLAELKSEQRLHKRIADARAVAMYLTRKVTGASYPEIGRAFGRDHTTVLYAVNRVAARINTDATFRSEVEYIEFMFV